MTPDRRANVRSVSSGLALTAVVAAGLAPAALRTPVAPARTAAGRSLAQPPVGVRATTTRPAGDGQALVARGYQVFQQSCARCHGAEAQGRGAAPPLANVGLSREEVEAAVREGIPPLMPTFGKRLRSDEIRAVADYVGALNPSVRPGGQIAGSDAGLPGISRGRMRGMGCPCLMMGRRD